MSEVWNQIGPAAVCSRHEPLDGMADLPMISINTRPGRAVEVHICRKCGLLYGRWTDWREGEDA